MLPSACLNTNGKGLFCPNQLHHPLEDKVGTGNANPIGMIMCAALMLQYSMGLIKEADCMWLSVRTALESGLATLDIYAQGKKAVTTKQMSDAICRNIAMT